jgi:hypothetical protein
MGVDLQRNRSPPSFLGALQTSEDHSVHNRLQIIIAHIVSPTTRQIRGKAALSSLSHSCQMSWNSSHLPFIHSLDLHIRRISHLIRFILRPSISKSDNRKTLPISFPDGITLCRDVF